MVESADVEPADMKGRLQCRQVLMVAGARGGSGGGGETWLSFGSILKELQM